MSERVQARPLWRCGSYDGPSSGIAYYKGRLHWFSMLGSPYKFRGTRAYALYPLTTSEAIRETIAHIIMSVLVGNYESFDRDGNRCGKAWPWRNWKWLWRNTLSLTDWIRGGYGARTKYTSRQSVGYFIFNKNLPIDRVARRLSVLRAATKRRQP